MSEEKPHILIVDDDDRLRVLLKKYLQDQGFLATGAENAADARRKMTWFSFDGLVLDVMMPKETGLELLRSLAEPRPPVLMLSAMGEAEDRIRGLETGADDYLPKPFEPKELVLRLRTILRRIAPAAKTIAFGNCLFDISQTRLTCSGEAITLTSSESALLKVLAEHAGSAVSREELAHASSVSERSVDVQVTRLRKKIGESGKPRHLQTVRGAGYILYADSSLGGGK